VLLPGHVEGVGQASHPHSNVPSDPGGRARIGGKSPPTGRRTVVGQRKGVVGSPQDLWDWEGGWGKDHRQTGSHPIRQK
jgi:hypothetical protein